jgi:hypothetical protein
MVINRRAIWAVSIIAFFCLTLLSALYAMVHHVPAYYRDAMLPAGKERQRQAAKFASDFAQFYQDVTYNRQWSAHFGQQAINSFFAEQLKQSGLSEQILPTADRSADRQTPFTLPEGLSDPRLLVRADGFRLGLRYRWGPLDAILSIDMRVWLAASELNVVALELRGLHVGALPISAQSLLERISEKARDNGIEVTWYRYHGNPVALLRYQADQELPTYRLDHIALKDHEIDVWGRSSDGPPMRTATPASIKKSR